MSGAYRDGGRIPNASPRHPRASAQPARAGCDSCACVARSYPWIPRSSLLSSVVRVRVSAVRNDRERPRARSVVRSVDGAKGRGTRSPRKSVVGKRVHLGRLATLGRFVLFEASTERIEVAECVTVQVESFHGRARFLASLRCDKWIMRAFEALASGKVIFSLSARNH